MAKDRNSYGSIMKSIGLFGGVQVFNILVSLIKNKFVAILLGPEGMGISGMLTNGTSMVSSLTGLGLRNSAVRDVAKSSRSDDKKEISVTIAVLRRLVLITGCIGMVVTFIFAPYLSEWSFGNKDYVWAFRVISVILLFDQLCTGQTVLMQGTFHYRLMAKSSLIGCVVGAVICIPLYYFFEYKGIVPVIVLSSLSSLLLSWFFSRKIEIEKIHVNFKQGLQRGKTMIQLGLSFAIIGALTTGKVFLLRMFIANEGSITDIGLYTAGAAISTQYINVILMSMGSDYTPRLAALSDDNAAFIEAVNRQTKLLITVVAPMIILFVVIIKELTIILYSTKFLPVMTMIEWMMFAMFFRTTSWCLSYTIAARGEAKRFLRNEMFSLAYSLIFSIIGYKYYRFAGLGIAFLLTYVCYTIHMWILCKRLYKFRYDKEILKVVLVFFALVTSIFVSLQLIGYGYLRYFVGGFGLIILTVVSLHYFNQMIPLRQLVDSFKSKILKKNV